MATWDIRSEKAARRRREWCAGYMVYLFQNDERKGRTEDPYLLSEYAEGEKNYAALKHMCVNAETREPMRNIEAKEQMFYQY